VFSPYNTIERLNGMPSRASTQISDLLVEWSKGDSQALEKLMPLVYNELRHLARFYLNHERSDMTWQGTELVHETYLRLAKQHTLDWKNKGQFFAFAAQLMRRLLVDHARNHGANKRGGSKVKVPLDEAAHVAESNREVDILALDPALDNLGSLDPRQARIVELRFFVGCSIEETAEILNLSSATVKREWVTARAWLQRAIRKES
jgi:RNA polymerase sigma factor (TIGR02999 family)